MVRIGLLGYGYWGPVLCSCFQSINQPIYAIADRHREKKESIDGDITFYTTIDELLNDPTITGVVVALPTSMHYNVCKKALCAGKHVLVEKPLTNTSSQAEELTHLAKSLGLTLMVDHHFIYKKSVQNIKFLANQGSLGTLFSYESTRANLGKFRNDDDVVWDLAPHDLSILKYILGKDPSSVSAVGFSHIDGSKADSAHVNLFYDNGFTAHLFLSWTIPEKIRTIYLCGTQGVAKYDDNESQYKLHHCDTSYTRTNDGKIVCSKNGWTPVDEDAENTLALVAREFIECIKTGEKPLSNGNFATDIVRTIEAIEASMKCYGKTTNIL